MKIYPVYGDRGQVKWFVAEHKKAFAVGFSLLEAFNKLISLIYV